ncbi:arylsulfatase [Penicillium canescens]|nr:arylsulfatase [Penicillium canescens]
MMKPNFLVIVSDDLGFSDLSAYGSEIDTPNLDKIAQEDAHIAGLGGMAERMNRFPEIFKDSPGYEGYLNFRVAALPEIMQDNGYFAVMSGKWYLGLEKELSPSARGFTKVLTTLPGAGIIIIMDCNFITRTKNHAPSWTALDFGWSTINLSTELPTFLRTFTRPIGPSGSQIARSGRERHCACGRRASYSPYIGHDKVGRAPRRGAAQIKPCMEIFAAMIDLVDVNVGRIRDYLESTGEWNDTFVVFMSDNGAEGQLLEAIPILAGATLEDVIKKYYDNSLEDLGNHNSVVWYGPQCASAATAPNRGAKPYTTEGGIRCPCIVRYPTGTDLQPGSIANTFTTVMYILPKVLDLSGLNTLGNNFEAETSPRSKANRGETSWSHLMRTRLICTIQ